MFIKTLRIIKGNDEIQTINFKCGLNFIVDETVSGNNTTGNSVGKTTVIKLIDFCLGADSKIIYTDDENKKKEYQLVKDFLIKNNVLVKVEFVSSLDDKNLKEVIIERNFLNKSKAIRRINGIDIPEKDFENTLSKELFGVSDLKVPTFNQLIAHNIRYKDIRISNTFKFLNAYATDQDYQFLFLYMFGCPFGKAEERIELLKKIELENSFKSKLEVKGTQNNFEMLLDTTNKAIEKLEKERQKNEDYTLYKKLIDRKNFNIEIINKLSTQNENLSLKIEIVKDSLQELEDETFTPDLKDIKTIYEEVKLFNNNLHDTFEDVVEYHRSMTRERKNFIEKDLLKLQEAKEQNDNQLNKIIIENKTISCQIVENHCKLDLEKIQLDLSKLYERKGEYESYILQFKECDDKISEINNDISLLDENLFSEKFQENLNIKLKNFNDYLSKVSMSLYNEGYLLTANIKTNKKLIKSYEFSIIYSDSYSTGKKQGEVLCFDLAYLQFAKDKNLPSLDFLANDKKELLHTNQMLKLNEFLVGKKIQFICSILKDKIPTELNKEENICIKLSQDSKLFKIKE